MSRSGNSRAATTRKTTMAAPRAAIVVVAAALCFVLLGGAHGSRGIQRPGAAAVSSPESQPGLPVVGRALGSTRFVAAPRAVTHRGTGFDLLAVAAAAIAMFARFRLRANPVAGRRPRFDAVFALRRGPPVLNVAH